MKFTSDTKLELNEQFLKALDLLENSSRNIFITGKAGTGKSTLLEYFRQNTKKKIAVLAPTGVAAVNVRGETIHSFFGFKTDITPSKVKRKKTAGSGKSIYEQLDAIVIDEISMVRADILDCVDKFLRLNGNSERQPFGGTQMIFIGDLYQLPPVVTSTEKEMFRSHYASEYFFSSHVFAEFEMEHVELEKIYRQKDQKFIEVLNGIRNNSITAQDIDFLNKRLDPNFDADGYIHLTTTNKAAGEINEKRLDALRGKQFVFPAEIFGKFDEKASPAEADLKIKKGAQVMLLNNDPLGRWVNGTIAEVAGVEREEDEDVIYVKLQNGDVEDVHKNKWEMFHYQFNELKGKIETHSAGSFVQYPLRLAWAITIHKSQGKTFDRAIIDMGRGAFATGQTYVALSRCRTLDGMVLKTPLKKSHVFVDWRVVNFLTGVQYARSEEDCPLEEKIEIIARAIREKSDLEIIYLKSQDMRSKRLVRPTSVGEMKYLGSQFIGMQALCLAQNESRTFRVDRILNMKVI